jgi:single-stranded-DNA-specific exonuclease
VLSPGVLARLGPFGAGHAEPRFALQAVRIAHTRVAGSAHLVCGLIDADSRLPAIAFRCADQPLGQALAAHAGAPFHLAGRLQPRHGGAALQLVIDDAAPALGG